MKPPRADARGILHFFGGIRRSTLLRSSSFGRSTFRIHPRPNSRGLLRRRINGKRLYRSCPKCGDHLGGVIAYQRRKRKIGL